MNVSSLTRLRAAVGALAVAALITLGALVPARALAVDPQYTFTGGGWGHGIGMSQWGARGYALQGWNYDTILKHYYQGTTVVAKPTVTIRVNLDATATARSQWWIKAGSETTLTVKQLSNTAERITLNPTSSYWITAKNGDTSVHTDLAYTYTSPTTGAVSRRHKPGAVLKTFSGTCYATAGGMIQLLGSSGPFNHAGVRWRGYVRFIPGSSTASTTKAVNHVDLESYLYGVVPRESPASWPAEALKAQAVAARSYAYQSGKENRMIYCTTRSQVYNGYQGPKGGEVASTNAAVDATTGQVVWYGTETKPVITYFSSCTGGHTASIQDVWTTSAAKPYFTGVADADEASPYYAWKLGAYSATYVSDKIRARDISGGGGLEYSVASPATITSITPERAASGYTHHVTFTWSNGKTYRVTGDTVRSALGMKSTKFGVTSSYPASAVRRYQNSDSRIAWTGYWKVQSKSGLSGSTLTYSGIANSSVTSVFNGTGVAWVGTKGPQFGKAEVYIDQELLKTVDLYSPATQYKRTLYTHTNLSPGAHTITVKVLRTRTSRSAGYLVGIDALDVYNGELQQATAPLARFEDTEPQYVLLGEWKPFGNAAYSAGRHLYTAQPKARFYATFYGSEVRWIGNASPGYGWATVRIDGGPAQKVVITTDGHEYQKLLFERTGLSQAQAHTIMIEASGHGGTDAYTAVDAIDVRGGWLIPAVIPRVTVQETHAAISWRGSWKPTRSKRLSGGSQRWSSTRSSEAIVTFEGTGITWRGRRAAWYGKSKVYLDGVYKGTVDQFGKRLVDRQVLWSSGRLTPTRHTLRIVVKGTKQKAAKATNVAIDAFEIAGRPLSP